MSLVLDVGDGSHVATFQLVLPPRCTSSKLVAHVLISVPSGLCFSGLQVTLNLRRPN